MIGIIVSDFNQTIVEGLLSGCKKALFEKGYNEKSMIIIEHQRESTTIKENQ